MTNLLLPSTESQVLDVEWLPIMDCTSCEDGTIMTANVTYENQNGEIFTVYDDHEECIACGYRD